MYHPSNLTPKTILKIQTAQRSVELTTEQHQRAVLKAHLYHAATVECDLEAREQLRLLSYITDAAQATYFGA